MCGRYLRKSDKQRIADAVGVTAGEIYLGPDEDAAPGSMQPVVSVNRDGARQIELMRLGFKLPDRLLFNARSEGIAPQDSGGIRSSSDGASFPPLLSLSGSRRQRAAKSRSAKSLFLARSHSAWRGIWNRWKNPKTDQW